MSAYNQSNYDAVVLGSFKKDILSFKLSYQCSRIEQKLAAQLCRHLENVLKNMAELNGNAQISDLDIFDDVERTLITQSWNQTDTPFDHSMCLHELIEKQAHENPDALAVIAGSEKLTFSEFNSKANQLARYLVEAGVKPDSFVGICLQRSASTMIGLLAIMKAGGAYVPLDPTLPVARLAYMIEDSQLRHVITQTSLKHLVPDSDCDVIFLDDESFQTSITDMPDQNISASHIGLTCENLAYMIYTSGSTGKPKGVLVNHKSLVNFLQFAQEEFLHEGIHGTIVSSPITFDATVQSLYTALIDGKSVELLTDELMPIESLSKKLFDSDFSYLFKITPAHLHALTALGVQHNEYARHTIVVAGELLTTEAIRPWMTHYLPNAVYFNEYGPTEATVGSSTLKLQIEDLDTYGHSVPIGKPVSNARYYVLNQHQQVQPVGIEGELYIGGEGLARGYHMRPELTAERFIVSPLTNTTDEKIYRTGDVVKWLPDGNVEFVSRIDNQVKIRGFRIELGEIESLLNGIEEVESAIVMTRSSEDGVDKLAAYIVSSETFDDDELLRDARQSMLTDSFKAHLKEHLPEYMVPESYAFLDAFPLTPNAKIDRAALSKQDNLVTTTTKYKPPQTEVEKSLCLVWQEVLKIEKIGVDDNFFALGGDSIVSIQLVSRAKIKGLNFNVKDLAENPTVAELSLKVNKTEEIVSPQEDIEGNIALLPIQIEFFAANHANPHFYNQSVYLRAESAIEKEGLESIITAILKRHDALRLRFDEHGSGGLHSGYDPNVAREIIQFYDLTGLSDADKVAKARSVYECTHESLNISTGPLIRVCHFKYNKDEDRILIIAHHLIIDGVSWRIFIKDLETGALQWRQTKSVELGLKTSSVQQWAQALHQFAYSAALNSEKAYWLNRLSVDIKPMPQARSRDDADITEYSKTSFSLNEKESKALLGASNTAYDTQINELFLSAILMAYRQWSGGQSILINFEGHGRDQLFEKLDVSETLGWFTKTYPLILDVEGGDGGDTIEAVRYQHRQVPNYGLGYGVLKNIKKDKDLIDALESQARTAIKFNYLGQLDATIGDQAVFQPVMDGSRLTGSSTAKENLISSEAMIVTGEVVDNQLTFNTSLSVQYESVDAFSHELKLALKKIAAHCIDVNKRNSLRKNTSVISAENEELRDKGISV